MARPKFTDEAVSNRKEAILTVAMDVLESGGGVEAVSFKKIAEAMNCTSAALYRYFPSKGDLLVVLRGRAFRWMEQALNEAIGEDHIETSNLQALSRAYIEFGVSRPELYQLMFFEIKNEDNSPYYSDLEAAKREALNVCTKVVAQAQANGILASFVDPLTAAHVFWASAHGLVSLEISNQLVMGRKIKVLSAIVINNVLTGLNHVKP